MSVISSVTHPLYLYKTPLLSLSFSFKAAGVQAQSGRSFSEMKSPNLTIDELASLPES